MQWQVGTWKLLVLPQNLLVSNTDNRQTRKQYTYLEEEFPDGFLEVADSEVVRVGVVYQVHHIWCQEPPRATSGRLDVQAAPYRTTQDSAGNLQVLSELCKKVKVYLIQLD